MDFAASVHCMDGRVQKPLINYITKNYNVRFVDAVTEPGPCGIISENTDKNTLDSIENRLNISINIHKAGIIFIPDITTAPVILWKKIYRKNR